MKQNPVSWYYELCFLKEMVLIIMSTEPYISQEIVECCWQSLQHILQRAGREWEFRSSCVFWLRKQQRDSLVKSPGRTFPYILCLSKTTCWINCKLIFCALSLFSGQDPIAFAQHLCFFLYPVHPIQKGADLKGMSVSSQKRSHFPTGLAINSRVVNINENRISFCILKWMM